MKNRKRISKNKFFFYKRKFLFSKNFFYSLLVFVTIISFYLIYLIFPSIKMQSFKILASYGFTIENISIQGQNHLTAKQIITKLKLTKGMPIFLFSVSDAKTELETFDWVQSANIKRVLPNKIKITIIERTPIALGQKNKKLYLIDNEGYVIIENNLKAFINLPLIIGEGAEIYAPTLIKLLKKDPNLFKEIYSISRISERRWNIKFNNELIIKLPEENIEQAWDKVIKIYQKNELFLPEVIIIDLRIPNKTFVEKIANDHTKAN